MNKLNRIDKLANFLGVAFGILFIVILLVGTVFPFGAALDTKAYLASGINLTYTMGLFIGLKWRASGVLVCIVSIVASIFIYFIGRTVVNYNYVIVFFLIQMTPVVFYMLSWYYHRQPKMN